MERDVAEIQGEIKEGGSRTSEIRPAESPITLVELPGPTLAKPG